jgi:hypothetical protein
MPTAVEELELLLMQPRQRRPLSDGDDGDAKGARVLIESLLNIDTSGVGALVEDGKCRPARTASLGAVLGWPRTTRHACGGRVELKADSQGWHAENKSRHDGRTPRGTSFLLARIQQANSPHKPSDLLG